MKMLKKLNWIGFSLVLLVSPTVADAQILDQHCLVKRLSASGWNDRNGAASKYKQAGSMYRCHKPITRRTPGGGLLVITTMDHIRNGTAEHDQAVVRLTFDARARLIEAQVRVVIVGKSTFSVKGEAKEMSLAKSVADQIYTKVDALKERGGRLFFSEDILQNINRIDYCTRVSPDNA